MKKNNSNYRHSQIELFDLKWNFEKVKPIILAAASGVVGGHQ